MDELLIEYGDKLRAIGCEMRTEFLHNGGHWIHILTVYSGGRLRIQEAGGGFLDPLEMFYYIDMLLQNYKNHGYLLSGGRQLANTTP